MSDWDAIRKTFLKNSLRMASLRWPARSEAIKSARVDRRLNSYTGRLCWHHRCTQCLKSYPVKEVRIDHIQPVVPTNLSSVYSLFQVPPALRSAFDVGSYVLRMLPEPQGFQVLCKECHDRKTKRESGERARTRLTTTGRKGRQ